MSKFEVIVLDSANSNKKKRKFENSDTSERQVENSEIVNKLEPIIIPQDITDGCLYICIANALETPDKRQAFTSLGAKKFHEIAISSRIKSKYPVIVSTGIGYSFADIAQYFKFCMKSSLIKEIETKPMNWKLKDLARLVKPNHLRSDGIYVIVGYIFERKHHEEIIEKLLEIVVSSGKHVEDYSIQRKLAKRYAIFCEEIDKKDEQFEPHAIALRANENGEIKLYDSLLSHAEHFRSLIDLANHFIDIKNIHFISITL